MKNRKIVIAALLLSLLMVLPSSAEPLPTPQPTLSPKAIEVKRKDYAPIDYDKAMMTTRTNNIECSVAAMIVEIVSKGSESNFYSLRASILDEQAEGKLIYLTTQVIDGRELNVGESYVFYGRAFGQKPDAAVPSPFVVPWIGVQAMEEVGFDGDIWRFWPSDAPYNY